MRSSTSNRLAAISVGGTAVRSFSYDGAGAMTGDARSGTAYAYTISDAGRIAQLSIGGQVKANYSYDARNRLSIRQTLNMTPSGTTHFVYDREDRLIAETDGAGTSVREYIWLGEVPVAVLDGTSSTTNPTLLWVEPAMSRAEGHANHLSQPELMTDSSRNVVWGARYEPFGAVSSIAGTAVNPLRFPDAPPPGHSRRRA